MKHKHPIRLCTAILLSLIGSFGCGLLGVCRALSGIDVSTLLFYYDQLKTDLECHRVSGIGDIISTYTVIADNVRTGLALALLVFGSLLFLWLPHLIPHTALTLRLRLKNRSWSIPLLQKQVPVRWLRVVSIGVLPLSLAVMACTVHLPRYLYLQTQESPIYAESYVDPTAVSIQFPEQKRNLIHIYLESVETTYQDTASGGHWPVDLIPQLTQLAEEHTSFSQLVSLTGTDYTSGALVAQTAGIAINRSLSKYSIDGQFLPYARTLHDILAEESYRQIFMCGSDGNFGSRTTYFTSHNCEMWDYYTAIEQGIVPEGYVEEVGGWGLRDCILLDWARSALTELAEGQEPFALSLLTVDTHFYDGALCDHCGDTLPTQYENVIRCSDTLVADFVRWCQEQPFYENTTILITGDHPTMDLTFIAQNANTVTERGVYTCIINPYDKLLPVNSGPRSASTFDIFPTTLSALGAQWEGHQLAFGVDLFSDAPTLVEQKGRELLDLQLQMPAEDYLKLFYRK